MSVDLQSGTASDPHNIALFDGKPMIFKLGKNWTGTGRKVARLTRGYFLVIAPSNWERVGGAPVEPDPCADPAFTAHYFAREAEGSSQSDGGFAGKEMLPERSGFSLQGKRVFDDSPEGDLFVGAVPELKLPNGVSWVRVGEERRNGWKGENFRPDQQSLADVLNGREGRFFLRIYDADVNLIDSGEFRYSKQLQDIHVNGKPYGRNTLIVPGEIGHSAARIDFVGVRELALTKEPQDLARKIAIRENSLTAAPNPEGDRISCRIGGHDGVVVVIILPRIWWRLEPTENGAEEWLDTPPRMTRQEFCHHVNTEATVWLRLPHRIKSTRVGFQRDPSWLQFPCEEPGSLPIPLFEFANHWQVHSRLTAELPLCATCDTFVLPLICIAADPAPAIALFEAEVSTVLPGETATLKWETRHAEPGSVRIEPEPGNVQPIGRAAVSPTRTTEYTLRLFDPSIEDETKSVVVAVAPQTGTSGRGISAMRKSGREWRSAKGFSDGELRAAGCSPLVASRLSLPIDRRRQSLHAVNVSAIRRVMDE